MKRSTSGESSIVILTLISSPLKGEDEGEGEINKKMREINE